ncbi:unnamed protein product [Penicillium salamii]|uniref:MARVEL domain-containing protein n=1 Tax=Penicillium salamii TaxID=1612424 RepID=A0A9W4NVC5_9EURO|nr:unnamed protein product [Penicillium salamii]CAG8336350.1 unnamed protein product [Penicillium salamii]CAG8338435.1 unnamed protein product [Penicillium salamii]CAG8387600.1 unnamed protein product [Penicillium salamii]CAG8395709.1 unnamed protein product [Penicillium salamii]
MSFLAVPLLKLGFSQAKKYKAKRDAQKYQDAGVYPPNYQPDNYPLSGYPPGAAPGTTVDYTPESKRAKLSFMLFSVLRFLQFVFGLTVIGLYGRDVRHDHVHNNAWHSQWVYALVAAFLATSTALIHLVKPFIMSKLKATTAPNPALLLPQFAWEFVLCVLWLALFGVFGKMYIGVYPKEDASDASRVNRMRHAVWIDVINLGFWVMSASWVLMRWLKSRKGDSDVDAEKAQI